VQILSESNDAKQCVKKMRTRGAELINNWGTICTPVEMLAAAGKREKYKPQIRKVFSESYNSYHRPKQNLLKCV